MNAADQDASLEATVETPEGAETEDQDEAPSGDLLRKTALIERVVQATGQKRKDVKPIIEATLKALGDALTAGEDLQMMPMGKVKIHKRKVVNGDEVMMLKLRRGAQPIAGHAPLAETED